VLLVLTAVGLALAAYVVAGSGSELTSASDTLGRLEPSWLLLAVAAEVASFVANAYAVYLLLSPSGSPGLTTLTGITVSGQAVANVLPAGVAASWVFIFRQLAHRRVDPVVATWALLVTGVASTGTLAALGLVGAEVAPADSGVPGLRPTAAVVLGVVLAVTVATRFLPGRHQAGHLLIRGWARLRRRPVSEDGVLARLRLVQRHPGLVTGAVVACGLAWLVDALALALCFQAVGTGIPWRGLAVAYTAGQLAAQLPITPGGLGVVEGSLTVALVSFGGGEASTLAAVLLYRLVSYWAVLPVGAASYGLLRRGSVP
jgi:uncharacterized membrane protein YbhN (UPF0104 family)